MPKYYNVNWELEENQIAMLNMVFNMAQDLIQIKKILLPKQDRDDLMIVEENISKVIHENNLCKDPACTWKRDEAVKKLLHQ